MTQAKVVVLDYGSGNVHSVVNALVNQGADVELTGDRAKALEADGLVVPGVGAFATVMEQLNAIGAPSLIDQRLSAGKPVFGICLGHQIMGLAAGAKTLKMKFGHHGANHPVKDLDTGRVAITSQNHGFAVDANTLPDNIRVTHVSLFDGSLQGLAWKDKPALCFQGHPEASPGPHDIAYLFDRFVELMNAASKKEGK